jgi:FkbM family methyltransferase
MKVQSATGTRLDIDIQDFIGSRILREGAYEPLSLARAVDLMSSGGVFVDVGSNFGLYTCTVGMRPGVTCLAVDPSAEAFSALQKNLALNPGVTAYLAHVAVANTGFLTRLEFPREDNLAMARVSEASLRDGSGYLVATTTLAEVLRHFQLDKIKLLKIDVEGYELQVLRGLDWSSSFRPVNIIMEFTDEIRTTYQTKEQCRAFLEERGYCAYTVEGTPYERGAPVPEDNLWFRED